MLCPRKNDFEVMGFENSEDFYKSLEVRIPDLVLLDIMLPGDDGLTILEKLRKIRNIKIFLLSSFQPKIPSLIV